jgi:hypothetical protein
VPTTRAAALPGVVALDLAAVTKDLELTANDSRSLRSWCIPSKGKTSEKFGSRPEGSSTVVTYAYEYPNPPDRESSGQGGVPIAPGPESSTTESRRRAKWFIGGALTVLLSVGAVAGVAVMNHTRQTSSSGPTTSSVTALQQWWADSQKDFTDMRNASEDADQAFSRFRPGTLAAACQHVHDAAEVKMLSHLPSPNPELTAELHAAIENFHSAAHLCLAVVAGSPANYDGEFLASMAQGNKHMRAAQDIINKMLTNV